MKPWVLGSLAVLLAAAACICQVARATTAAADPVAPYVDAIAAKQDPRVAAALALIDGTGRRLLALRSYFRSGGRLTERWSWDEQQIAAYEQSPEYRELQAEIERVRQAFAEANPGYDLWVNPQVRSLDIQIDHWNTNESVADAAADLLAAAQELVTSAGFPAPGSEAARRAIEAFLSGHAPIVTPTIAAPGLSPHGQMRAIDFQVQKDGRIVAGPKTATIDTDWDAAGWTHKLEEAVRTASNRFDGPLVSPREPWHYTYSPEAVAAR
jgi:hypothetical protein